MSAAVLLHPFTVRTSRRCRGGDVALAVATAASWWGLLEHAGESGIVEVCSIVVSAAAIAAWRASPPASLSVTLAMSLILVGAGATTWPPLGPVVAGYLVAASDVRPEGVVRRSSTLVGAAGVMYVASVIGSPERELTVVVHAVLAFAVAWFAGERTRLRHEQVADLHQRVHDAVRAAEQETRLAVSEERTRIARDLHDSAGHALNVIAVRAGAAHLRADGDRALDALADIADLARRTAAEVDHTVGRLREYDEPSRLPIGLASADSLIQEHRDAGLEVETIGGPAAELSGAADQTAYRFLQEALTNAARHGAGSAQVEFSSPHDPFSLTVTNPIAGDVPQRSGHNGHGLIGMRERAALLGGTATVTRTDHDFVVRLALPPETQR